MLVTKPRTVLSRGIALQRKRAGLGQHFGSNHAFSLQWDGALRFEQGEYLIDL